MRKKRKYANVSVTKGARLTKDTFIPPPTKLKFAFVDYVVLPCLEEYAKENAIRGETDFDLSEIIYRKDGISKFEATSTVIHEILHAVAYTFGIQFKSEEEEEMWVNATANGLTTVFRDNPNLVKWLYKIFVDEKVDYEPED